jgi:hypothetical protein
MARAGVGGRGSRDHSALGSGEVQEAVITHEVSRSQQSYRHEALLWHTAEDFTDTLVTFVGEGLDAGEPVMVAVTPQHTAWLQEALGERAAQ